MVMVLSLYSQLDMATLKLSGTVALSNQAVTGNTDSPSPGLPSQYNRVSTVFWLTSSDVN